MKRIITKYIPSLKKNIIYKLETECNNNFEWIYDAEPEDILFRLIDGSFHVIACLKNLTYNTLDDEMPNYYNLNFDELNIKQKEDILKQGALICKKYSMLKLNKKVKVLYTKIENFCNENNFKTFKTDMICV
jgi:hypothetical protein